jgi:hypothetical protein
MSTEDAIRNSSQVTFILSAIRKILSRKEKKKMLRERNELSSSTFADDDDPYHNAGTIGSPSLLVEVLRLSWLKFRTFT